MWDYTPRMNSRLLGLPGLALATVVLSLAALPACAADEPADDSTEATEADELNTSKLRSMTAIKGSVAGGAALTVDYLGSDAPYPVAVPFLAVEILPTPAQPTTTTSGVRPRNGETGALQTITVQGDFPGTPRVLVVDEEFRVLSGANATTLPNGTETATITTPRSAAKRFVLVRDGRWSRPMQFSVNVGR